MQNKFLPPPHKKGLGTIPPLLPSLQPTTLSLTIIISVTFDVIVSHHRRRSTVSSHVATGVHRWTSPRSFSGPHLTTGPLLRSYSIIEHIMWLPWISPQTCVGFDNLPLRSPTLTRRTSHTHPGRLPKSTRRVWAVRSFRSYDIFRPPYCNTCISRRISTLGRPPDHFRKWPPGRVFDVNKETVLVRRTYVIITHDHGPPVPYYVGVCPSSNFCHFIAHSNVVMKNQP